MARIAMTDGSGRWFDDSKAKCWHDATWFNGSNLIRKTTNDQWSGQWLYRTASGAYVLHNWSARGGADGYDIIDDQEAAQWLASNGHDDDILAAQIAELEL